MSRSDEFRQYAQEAMLSASQSKNEPEIKALAELAQFWAQAALQSERTEAVRKTVR